MAKKLALLLAFVMCLCLFVPDAMVWAEKAGGYLSDYSEVDPRPTSASWWSTLAYLASLLAAFAFVVVMAYIASRFLGGRFEKAAERGGGRVFASLPLGPNRLVCAVELAGRVFMLGVTEHSITLLHEITDEEEIASLRRRDTGADMTGGMLSSQLGSIDRLAKRIPSFFHGDTRRG